MVVPNNRKEEFLNINDHLFIDNFKYYNWKYIFYSDIVNMISLRKIDVKTIPVFAKGF
jgi:hypothetical protein